MVPGLLGADGERTYLIAFLNPSEQRGLGGFIGNYAEITAVAKYFEAALVDRDHNPGLAWCTTDWIKKQLTQLEKTIDGSLDRWRALYREAKSSLTKATTIR